MKSKVALVGATGFVGSAVAEALSTQCDLKAMKAPRLSTSARTASELQAEAARVPLLGALINELADVDTLINAAGNPDASSLDEDALFGANALLPALLLHAAAAAGVRRMVQISSAVVQNDKATLDSSDDLRAFSPYSASKCMGEEVLRAGASGLETVRYRPPSVHAPNRRVTRMIRRIAKSPAATVARPGDQPTPQSLLINVASAVAFLAITDSQLPAVVHHPWEGVTVTSLMEDLSGGHRPVRLPRWLAKLTVRVAKSLGRFHRPTAANARRVELLWLGQHQAPSWLTTSGWTPPVGAEGWKMLAREER